MDFILKCMFVIVLIVVGVVVYTFIKVNREEKERLFKEEKSKELIRQQKEDEDKEYQEMLQESREHKKLLKEMDKSKKKNSFNVAGVTYENRQEIIKEIVKDWKECNADDIYEGMSNKDIKELDIEVYEVDIYNWCNIDLVPEPDNKYDSNAIKVISDFGTLGYVPSNQTSKVKKVLEGDYTLDWKLVGGKYKFYDDLDNKVRTKTLTYGIQITLTR